MKKLLLIGTALLSVTSYVSAMNSITPQPSSGIDSINSTSVGKTITHTPSLPTITDTNALPPLPVNKSNISINNMSASKTVASFKDWNDIWDGLWDKNLTSQEYNEKLTIYLRNNANTIILKDSTNWEKMINKMTTFEDSISKIEQARIKEGHGIENQSWHEYYNLRRKIQNLKNKLIKYEGFELLAAKQTKVLYNIIRTKVLDFLLNKTVTDSIKRLTIKMTRDLFEIFINEQKAQIDSDLVR